MRQEAGHRTDGTPRGASRATWPRASRQRLKRQSGCAALTSDRDMKCLSAPPPAATPFGPSVRGVARALFGERGTAIPLCRMRSAAASSSLCALSLIPSVSMKMASRCSHVQYLERRCAIPHLSTNCCHPASVSTSRDGAAAAKCVKQWWTSRSCLLKTSATCARKGRSGKDTGYF